MNNKLMSHEEIVVVSGLPRSGTSMMMQMLEAGGVPILSDHQRKADDDNPRGYYEYEKTKKLLRENDWLSDARGKAIKIVAPLLANLKKEERYRVLFMERSMEHVIDSQNRMLQRLGRKGGGLSDQKLAETYLQQIARIRTLFCQHEGQIHVLTIQYGDTVTDPGGIAKMVNEFLGHGLDVPAMTHCVDPDLCRHGSLSDRH